MSTHRKNALALTVAVVLAAGFVVGLLQYSGAAPWTTGYELKVMFPTAGSMGPGASVRISGQRVGKVLSVERRGVAAILELQISDAKTPLPEDTRAAIRLRTFVGENYVELTPGRSKTKLPDGGMLPMRQSDGYVEADQILSTLRGKARERAREFLQGFGQGLEGHGAELNTILRNNSRLVLAADDLTAVLANDHRQVADLVEHVGDVTRAIGDRSAAVRRLATSGRQSFQALADRDDALQDTLEALPATLAQVRETAGLVGTTTRAVSPVVGGLARGVDDLRPVFDRLPRAAGAGRAVMRTLHGAAPRLTRTLAGLRALSGPTKSALPRVRGVLCELNPMAAYLTDRGPDLAGMLSNMASSTNFYDATGHAARFQALVGLNSFTAIPDAGRETLQTLQKAGVFRPLGSLGGYQPYPKAGDVGTPSGGEGDLGPRDSDLPYTRVRAEC